VRVRAVVDDSHDDATETDTYYGHIEEIWEPDYVGLKVALFQCRWVTNGKRAMSKDKYGSVSVDLRVFGYKNESFFSPMMLSKFSMYLTLQRRIDLWLCLEKRIVGVENVVEEEECNQFDKIPSFNTSY
jgi:hypothetical protein